MWTNDLILHAASLRGEGLSCAKIAVELNKIHNTSFTKNSVIGIFSRKLGGTPPIDKKDKKISFTDQRHGFKSNPHIRVLFKKSKLERKKPFKEEECHEPRSSITIFDLKNSSCRYMTGKHLYCGDTVQRGSFCEHHAKKCYIDRVKAQ